MTFSSHIWARSVCRRSVRAPIQMKPSLRADLSYVNMRADSRYADSQAEDNRIYIYGIGCIANLFAHSLAKKPWRPPITFLWKKPALLRKWKNFGACIEIKRKNVSDKQHAFNAEIAPRGVGSVLVGGPIRNVIVCGRDTDTTEAISSIKHRLNEQSTILFTQSCMGVIEEVSERVFPDAKSRPNFMAGRVFHNIRQVGVFSSTHKGLGGVTIAVLPRGQLDDARKDETNSTPPPPEPSRHLIQQILDAPALVGKEVSIIEFIQAQMERLVSNAMTRPLSVIFDRGYAELFDQSKIQSLMRLLLCEASHVIRALPELQKDAGLAARFSPERLEWLLEGGYERHGNRPKDSMPRDIKAGNRPKDPMPLDVKAGKLREIDYMNGYIVKKGEQLGIDCLHNRTLVKMVKENQVITESQIDEFFPRERGS